MKQIFKKLSEKDKKLSKILESDIHCIFHKKEKFTANQHFLSLCREIIGQQLSVKAAKSIWERFIKGIRSNKKLIEKIKSSNVDACPVFLIHDAIGIDVRKSQLKKLRALCKDGLYSETIGINFPVRIKEIK